MCQFVPLKNANFHAEGASQLYFYGPEIVGKSRLFGTKKGL
jgi:hypothetical protein